MTEPTPQELATWRAYERTGTYRGAAASGDPLVPTTIPMVRRILSELYHRIGATTNVQAGFLLRSRGLTEPVTSVTIGEPESRQV